MIPDKHLTLIDSLLQKTAEGKANWSRTGASGQYVIILEAGSIKLDQFFYNHHDDTNRGYALTLLNSNGDRIDEIQQEEGDQHYELMKTLYDAVERDYLRVDETIDGMLSELDSKRVVGARPPEPDDDLPF